MTRDTATHHEQQQKNDNAQPIPSDQASELRPSMSNPSSPQASFSFEQQLQQEQQEQQYGEHSIVSPPQLYTKDELIIKIPGSVQSMSPTRLPPTPTSEASKAVDLSPIVAYDTSGSPMASSRPSYNLSPPPSSSSSSLPPPPPPAATTTTTEVTTWSSSSNDTSSNNDDIHFAAQGYDSWFDNSKTSSSFNVSSAAIPSPQHSTDRLATRGTTSPTTEYQPSVKRDDDSSYKVSSSKMYSDHMDDEMRPTSPPSPMTWQRPRNTDNPWSTATLVDSWEGFQPFVQTVKPTPVMKHPKKYRQPDDILQPLDEQPQKEEIDNNDNDNDHQQHEEQENVTIDTQQQEQPLSSGSSDQYEDALSSPTKSEYEADAHHHDNIKMTFDDVEVDEPTRDKNKANDVDDDDDDDDDDDGDWVYSREELMDMQPTHHVRRYSRDELMDMQPELKEGSELGLGAKERIDNFISVRQA